MKHLSIAALALFCLLAGMKTEAQTAYTIQDLGNLGGIYINVSGLNNNGDIVANSALNSQYITSLYHNGVLQDITAQVGGNVGNINDAGQIATQSPLTHQASLYNINTGQRQIVGPVTTYGSNATVVSNSGVVAGTINSRPPFDPTPTAALFQNGQATPLSSFPGGGGPISAQAINNNGDVAGEAIVANNASHAYRYSKGVSYDLGTLPGGRIAIATGINDSGAVVGYSDGAGIQLDHAFLYQNGKMQDLGTFGGAYSAANSINNAGVVVGEADTQSVATEPFVYSNGVMRNLFDLIPDGSQWGNGFGSADAINDKGQIAGVAFHNGREVLFLATPVAVPEPGAFVCFGIGLVALGGLLRRRVRAA